MANGFDPNTISYMKQVIAANGGLQRTNRFSVEFKPPAEVALPKTEIACQDVIFPEKNINAVADTLSGPGLGRAVPKALEYINGVSLVYPTYNNWAVEDFFQRWQKYLFGQDNNGNWITQYYDTAVKPTFLKVKAYDLNGNITTIHTFWEVYPISIVPNANFTMRAGDRPVNSNMYTMYFRLWENKPINNPVR